MKSVTPLPYDTLPKSCVDMGHDLSAFDKLRKCSKICLMDDQDCQTGAFYPDYTVASTNSICRAVSSGGDFRGLLDKVCQCAKSSQGSLKDRTDYAMTKLFLDCARKMDSRAHTGVFVDIYPTSQKAEDIVSCAENTARSLLECGVKEDRFMISIPASHEGLSAMKKLDGRVNCNASCVFSIEQAVKAAEVGARAVSVGVGDLSDYWRWKTGDESPAWDDRGVQLCLNIQSTLRSLNHQDTLTVAMNCRTVSQVLELAGIDCVAVAPWMMRDLSCRCSSDVYCHVTGCHQTSRSSKRTILERFLGRWPDDALDLLSQAETRRVACLSKLNRTISGNLSPFLDPEP